MPGRRTASASWPWANVALGLALALCAVRGDAAPNDLYENQGDGAYREIGASVMAATAAGPVEDYYRACEMPYYEYLAAAEPTFGDDEELLLIDSAHAAARVPCTALVERLSKRPNPTVEERLALFMARDWLGLGTFPDQEAKCRASRAFAAELPRLPDALYELGLCAERMETTIALMREALDLDPRHFNALSALTGFVDHTGEHFGINARRLTRYGEMLYEVAPDRLSKSNAAARLLIAADAGGDVRAAADIRDRVRRDFGLDVLDSTTVGGYSRLRRACYQGLFAFDLEAYCLTTVETFADAAANEGREVPDDLLRIVAAVAERLAHLRDAAGPWDAASKATALTRLRTMLDAYPDGLKSSEHHRVADALRSRGVAEATEGANAGR